MNSKTCLIIAGEKSGEEHALSFLPQLIKQNPQIHYFGVGGPDLKNLGVELIYNLESFSSWGISDVVKKINFYRKAFKNILSQVDQRETKVAILIDFQTFNLKLAIKLKERGVKVLYYVAPQAWAWKPWRVVPLAASVQTLYTIIPFEKNWFKSRGVSNVIAVSHPILARFHKFLNVKKNLSGPWDILILPGSRNQEVSYMLPEFIEAVTRLREKCEINVTLVKSRSVSNEKYDYWEKKVDKVLMDDDLEEGLINADLAIAASGTVTLTTALFKIPTVVCYKSSLLNELVFQTFVDYSGPISLANIVHQKFVFPEYIQDQVSGYNIFKKLQFWINHPNEYNKLVEELDATKNLLAGDPVDVSDDMQEAIKKAYE